MTQDAAGDPAVAGMYSGGLDSAVLVAHAATQSAVQPIYVSVGLAWEREELAAAMRLFARGAFGSRVRPLVPLRLDMQDVYPGDPWAIRGEAPGFYTPDAGVYAAGRKLGLL